jgi:phospholipid transport system substrate-binding protein
LALAPPARDVENLRVIYRFRKWLLALACLGAAAPGAHAGESQIATDTPVAAVQSLQRGLIAASQQSPHATVDERYKALEPVIVGTHDLAYIAEFALRRQWPTLSEADRTRFIAAFERLSVMTYAARFVNVSSSTFRPIAEEPGTEAGRAHVSTAVARAEAPDVPMEYLLQQGTGGWRIINIVADGVSDLALKRAEYQRILASGTLDTLIEELAAQTERLRRR